jgi:hypothetical protein
MKEFAKRVAKNGLRLVRKVRPLGYVLDQWSSGYAGLFPEVFAGKNWGLVDGVFSACRRRLRHDPDWRLGPDRVKEVAREAFDRLSACTSLENRVYCDLGCGKLHPYGPSAVMYLNGAGSAIALDLADADPRRAAEALYDLLVECIVFPDHWHWSGISREDFNRRARQFNLEALRDGDLRVGLELTPLRHVVTDIHNPCLAEGAIDIMASRAVLEHFLDFGLAVQRLYALMAPGAVAFHHIDLVDHRAYGDPSRYHWWSFLAEDDDWSNGHVNRLRASEIRALFEKAGFEVLRYDCQKGQMPEGFRSRLKGRFARMPDDELNTIWVELVLRRPGKPSVKLPALAPSSWRTDRWMT